VGFRRNWARAPRTVTLSFPAIRSLGPRLFPEPEPVCCELAPLPPALESLPGALQDAIKKGVQLALRDAPPATVSLAPNTAAPFRSRPLNETVVVVVGGDNQSFEADVLKKALVGGATGTTPIIEVDPDNSVAIDKAIQFAFFRALDYERIHISGVDFVASSLDAYTALAFTILVDGIAVVDRASLLALRELSIDVAPKSKVSFLVSNADLNSSFVVYFTPKGWIYACDGQGNYLSQALLRQDGQWQEPNDACVPPRRRLGANRVNGACP
jgi:hypothetical protein